jgi:hypothetical protein
MSCGKETQLGQIDTSHRLLHDSRRHDQLNCIVVNQWNMVTYGNEMRRNVMFNEMLELE